MKRRLGWVLSIGIPGALAALVMTSRAPHSSKPALALGPSAAPAIRSPDAEDDDAHDDGRTFVFRLPSGEPTALTCSEARAIVEQVRAGLAYVPAEVPESSLGASAADWLDPHGLLTLARDASVGAEVAAAAGPLLADLDGRKPGGCEAAQHPGDALARWSDELRGVFDRARKAEPGVENAADAWREPLPPAGLAKETARLLGARVAAFENTFGEEARPFAESARRRFFPALDGDGWAKVVLASTVRAYVPLVDPHGEWAPFDEESRVYEVDLSSRPPERMWTRAVSTAVGIRVTEPRIPTLEVDDVVLSVGGVETAGLPLEQVDQLAFATSPNKLPLTATLVRGRALKTVTLSWEGSDAPEATARAGNLPFVRIPYGDADVLLVDVDDVRDDLGDELAARIQEERRRGRALAGIVLDLRGNGGGSTDGAIGALSLFLPGAPLFAMKRRDGTVEVDRAGVPPESEQWTGPVATLVDATTASAAEMIAGALAAYRRGTSIGTATFGKGCAQEYVDDDAHAGVLRLTTLVYALPDGSPVQRVGLVPQLKYPFAPSGEGSDERESTLARSAPSFRGPDLRSRAPRVDSAPWPPSVANVGPCRDAEVCRALRLLGGPKRPAPPPPVAKH